MSILSENFIKREKFPFIVNVIVKFHKAGEIPIQCNVLVKFHKWEKYPFIANVIVKFHEGGEIEMTKQSTQAPDAKSKDIYKLHRTLRMQ